MKRVLLTLALLLAPAIAQAEIRVRHGYSGYPNPIPAAQYNRPNYYTRQIFKPTPENIYPQYPQGGWQMGSGGFMYNPYYNPYYGGLAPQSGFIVPSGIYGP